MLARDHLTGYDLYNVRGERQAVVTKTPIWEAEKPSHLLT